MCSPFDQLFSGNAHSKHSRVSVLLFAIKLFFALSGLLRMPFPTLIVFVYTYFIKYGATFSVEIL